MTYQERKTLVNGLIALILLTGYLTYGFKAYTERGEALLQDAHFWSLTILMSLGVAITTGIVIQVLFHIALSLRNEVVRGAYNKLGKAATEDASKEDTSKEDTSKEDASKEDTSKEDTSTGVVEIEGVTDERDRAIASKATRLQFGIVVMGIILMLGIMALTLPVGIALSVLFSCFVFGMLTNSMVQLYYYRKGV